jgi:hypothetical protein
MTTQLKELLDSAADSRVSPDLGQRAVAEARRRRTRRLALRGSALAVAAVALGVVLAVQPFRTDAEPRPTDVASLPAQLPPAEGLPTLAEAPMDAASAAYLAGQLVLVSAADGHAAVAAYDLPVGLDSARHLALSPDGKSLLVDHVKNNVITTDGTAAPESLFFLDVASGTVEPVGLSPTSLPSGLPPTPETLAWAPDSSSFACVCQEGSSAAQTHVVDPSAPAGLQHGAPMPAASGGLSWGMAGLALGLDGPHPGWWLMDNGQLSTQRSRPSLDRLTNTVPGLALSLDADRDYLAAGPDGYRIVSDGGVVAHGSLEGAPLAFVQAATDGYLVATWPAGSPSPPLEHTPGPPLDVRFVGPDGTQARITGLPAGTASASFAAALVGAPTTGR